MNLRVLISYYSPREIVSEKQDVLFKTLLALLGKEGVTKDPIVDQIFGFVRSEENLRASIEWLRQSKITVDGQELYELKQNHKLSIVKTAFKASCLSLEEKQELLNQTLGDDRSDLSENCRATCESSLPDPEIKARVWAEVTDPSNTDSLYKRRAKIEGFYAFSQFDIVEPYFDKFFDVLPMVYEKMTHKNFEGFFYGFLPRMEVKD